MVLEVGLGGRLDATNVVTPELCVITPIDFDHEAWLGTSLEAIAGEKAGILKAGVPAVFARAASAKRLRVLGRARRANSASRVTRTERVAIDDLELDAARQPLSADRGELELRIDCPLAGEHQVENARTAAVALHAAWDCRAAAIERGHRAGALARPAGARVASSPRSSSTARTIPPAPARWRLHRALLCAAAGLADLRRDAR